MRCPQYIQAYGLLFSVVHTSVPGLENTLLKMQFRGLLTDYRGLPSPSGEETDGKGPLFIQFPFRGGACLKIFLLCFKKIIS